MRWAELVARIGDIRCAYYYNSGCEMWQEETISKT